MLRTPHQRGCPREARANPALKVRLLAVGKAPRWIDEGLAEYAKRLPSENALELAVVSPRRGQSDENRLLAEVRSKEIVVVLDRRGEALSSEAFAALVAQWRMGRRDVAILIGGASGFSESARQRAQHVLSLSAMTLPHLLVRVVVAEQIYRAWTILAGHPYHR